MGKSTIEAESDNQKLSAGSPDGGQFGPALDALGSVAREQRRRQAEQKFIEMLENHFEQFLPGEVDRMLAKAERMLKHIEIN